MTALSVCLTWIRYLRRLRRECAFGTLEREALAWNFREARRLANARKGRPE